jgi:hypothetical protein
MIVAEFDPPAATVVVAAARIVVAGSVVGGWGVAPELAVAVGGVAETIRKNVTGP